MTIRLCFGAKTVGGVKLIIFDKDGTLTDLYAYWSHVARVRARIICGKLSLGEAAEEGVMGAMGLDLANQRFRPEGPIGVKKRADVLAAVVAFVEPLGATGAAKACDDAFRETDEAIEADLPRIVKPIPGAKEFLEKVRPGCRVAIATADNTARAQLAMEIAGMDGVDLIVGSDEVKKGKPDPEIANVIMGRLGERPESTVLIGDSKADLLCGANAGLLASVGVATGIAGREELSKYSDFVVGNLSEITVLGD